VRHPEPPVPRSCREGDHAAVPGGASPRTAGVSRGHVRGRLRHPSRHARPRQSLANFGRAFLPAEFHIQHSNFLIQRSSVNTKYQEMSSRLLILTFTTALDR
jgi:hypothetical protein